MSRNPDIRALLDEWPFDPEKTIRTVRLSEERVVLQVRLPFGIEQYERDGRPDGKRPYGMDSVLAYHLSRLASAKAEDETACFSLKSNECAELFEEGVIYYYRYLHLFQMQDWERTARDTARNIRLFDFVHRYAESEHDRLYLEQWRPYVLRINAVAASMIALRDHDHEKALRLVESTLQQVRDLEELDSQTFASERERSIDALEEMAKQIRRSKPLSEDERLEQELKRAVAAEDFERAAVLRDRIRELQDNPVGRRSG